VEIEVTEASQVTVVVPKGDLDTAAAAQLRRTLNDLLGAGKTRFVVDLGAVGYIDSASLGQLVSAMKRAREAGGDLRLCGLRGNVLQIFEMTRLNEGMAVYPARKDALASWK
jgi:anti-anti-sigma factor